MAPIKLNVLGGNADFPVVVLSTDKRRRSKRATRWPALTIFTDSQGPSNLPINTLRLPTELRFMVYQHCSAFTLLQLSHTCTAHRFEILNCIPKILTSSEGYQESEGYADAETEELTLRNGTILSLNNIESVDSPEEAILYDRQRRTGYNFELRDTECADRVLQQSAVCKACLWGSRYILSGNTCYNEIRSALVDKYYSTSSKNDELSPWHNAMEAQEVVCRTGLGESRIMRTLEKMERAALDLEYYEDLRVRGY
ncbi:hypothetical protein BJ508DRAFT_350814 [Ascobolus immersus RN42]|uniref:F-box domain-containing protein n=1 Tax=Ascobolus immersus RN42 TaxID=1160509 RepID=A0A3N4HV76_ASCIM|nr:hypothetical protein BJ508DRAFT_350814 [Ascobolus immersus RN42]